MLPTEPNTPPNSRVWRVVHFPLVLLVVAIAMLALSGLLSGAINVAVAGRGGRLPGAPITGAIEGALFVSLVYWLFVRFVERRRRVEELGGRGWFAELGAGWLAGIVLFSVVFAIIYALGGYRILGTNPPGVLLVPFVLSLCTGVVEEIVLRGIFFRLIERLLGSWIALALSALLFGAAHLGNPNATWFAGLAIALEAGVMLAALYMVTRRLWAAIGLHAAWNFAQGAIYGIAVSGFPATGLLRPETIGSDLLTGGHFGAEASLPSIAVDTAFGVALLVVAVRRGRIVAPMWSRRRQGTALHA